MKPRNFPERKRQRQIEAARRAGDLERVTKLTAKGSQRGVRTKKDRSANARFTRS